MIRGLFAVAMTVTAAVTTIAVAAISTGRGIDRAYASMSFDDDSIYC